MKNTTMIMIASLVIISGSRVAGQNVHFSTSGIIEYEKSVNVYAVLRRQINTGNETAYRPLLEQYKKNNPQFKKLRSTLFFSGNRTKYTHLAEENSAEIFLGSAAILNQNNITYTNLEKESIISQKEIFSTTFLLMDSVRRIHWKVTDEIRDIAGYTCRRANALIDSIYVVAFYAEEIPVSGGPESFTGLPGMILGIALPHENTMWFATKVTDMRIENDKLKPPTEGKVINRKQLTKMLNETMKKWGSYGKSFLSAYSL